MGGTGAGSGAGASSAGAGASGASGSSAVSAGGSSPSSPASTWSGAGTEGFRLKNRSFFSTGGGSTFLPTRGPSSTGMSIWGV